MHALLLNLPQLSVTSCKVCVNDSEGAGAAQAVQRADHRLVLDRFLKESQGLLLLTNAFLYDAITEASLHSAIRNGKRAVVWVDPNDLERSNNFLERYGIEGTRVGAFLREPLTDHPRIIPLQRSQNPLSFALPDLLEGVNEIALQQPNVLRLDDRALPVLTLPLDIVDLTDLSRDFFFEWPTSSVAVLALSDESESTAGAVIAFTPGFWHDAYVGATGVQFPGITFGDNRVLTRNIIEWLIQKRLPPTSHEVQAYTLISKIEHCLARIVTTVLGRAYGHDWWNSDGIPAKIRESAERFSERENRYLPARAYLGIDEFRSIIHVNWQWFATPFEAGAVVGEQSQALEWYAQLRQIRNRTMHPAKELVSGAVISPNDITALAALCERLRLVEGACERPV